MSDATRAAVLGGTPLISEQAQPTWPESGLLENAAQNEVTDSGKWVGFRGKPAKWRASLEQVTASTMGYRYAVGTANGTLAITSGLRIQFRARGSGWAEGRSQIVLPDFTCTPAYYAFLLTLAADLGRVPELVPIDAKPDGTMDDDATAAYLAEHHKKVLAVAPVTMYGNYGAIGRFVDLAKQYDLAIHHDDAHGAAARYDGPQAVTASVSCHADAKPTPTDEGGILFVNDPEIARGLRADSDCGISVGRVDPIPYAPESPIPSGQHRMGEQTAALLLMQWLRAMHARLQARENRRALQEVLNQRFDKPVLWNPAADAEYPPFYMLYLLCTPELEEVLRISPAKLREFLEAEGMYAEAPYVPGHQDPAWNYLAAGREFSVGAHIRERGVIIHTKWLRNAKFLLRLGDIFDKLLAHLDSKEFRAWAAGE